ncbi:MAG: zinc ribbon domain-containing protein [Ruminococcaceae bacterium]|nr:zinc ribbon domain-containing protein [Oscillospiraceae bacterium]
MFCSKCGKEVQEGTAFCSSCGQPLQNTDGGPANNVQPQIIYVNQSNSGIMSTPPEEKKKKTTAIGFYFISAILSLCIILTVLGSKLELLAGFISTDLSQDTIAAAFRSIYEEHAAILWCLGILYLSIPITQGIVLWCMYKKRNFILRINNVILQNILDSVFWFIFPIIINIVISRNSRIEGSASFFFWAMAIVIIALKIIYIVLYYKASECEEINLRKEKHNVSNSGEQKPKDSGTYWICTNCRTFNSPKDMFCQKCGKNK